MNMECSSATMPRRKYRALDSQQLTVPSRSASPTSQDSYEHSETFWSDLAGSTLFCRRGRNHLFTPDQHPLELPPSYIRKSASRPALEQLRFGSSGVAADQDSVDDVTSSNQSTESRIFSESDFPPLQRYSSTLSIIVDSGFERRRVSLPETQNQHYYHRNLSAPVPDSRIGSKKPTLRSTRYRDRGSDYQTSQHTSLSPVKIDDLSSVDATTKSLRKDSILTPVEAETRRVRHDMASAFPQMSGDARRHYPSGTPRYENRPPVNRATPCKNGPLCRKFQEGWTPCPI